MQTNQQIDLPHRGTMTRSGTIQQADKVQFLKRLRPEWATNTTIVDRFIASYSRNRNIRNRRFIASMITARQDADGVFLTREYVEGQPLEQWLVGQQPSLNIKEFANQLCEALRQLHNRDIIHGGIHPGNVIIRPSGELKLTDEGISKAVLTNEIDTAYPMRAVRYLAPEQWQGQPISKATDLYSAALLIGSLLEQRELVHGDSIPSIKNQVLSGIPHPATPLAKALQIDPAARFRNAEEMQQAFSNWLTETIIETEGGDTTEEITVIEELVGTLVELTDLKNQLNLMTCYGGQPWQLPRTGQEQQWPMVFKNGGPGDLQLTFRCLGEGATLSPRSTVRLRPGQRGYAILNLSPQGSDWVRLDVTWYGQKKAEQLNIRLYRPQGTH